MGLCKTLFIAHYVKSVCTDPLLLYIKNTQRVKLILYIYIFYMRLNSVSSIDVFEIAAFNLKLRQYEQLMEYPRKYSSARIQPCHHKYKENFNISRCLIQ